MSSPRKSQVMHDCLAAYVAYLKGRRAANKRARAARSPQVQSTARAGEAGLHIYTYLIPLPEPPGGWDKWEPVPFEEYSSYQRGDLWFHPEANAWINLDLGTVSLNGLRREEDWAYRRWFLRPKSYAQPTQANDKVFGPTEPQNLDAQLDETRVRPITLEEHKMFCAGLDKGKESANEQPWHKLSERQPTEDDLPIVLEKNGEYGLYFGPKSITCVSYMWNYWRSIGTPPREKTQEDKDEEAFEKEHGPCKDQTLCAYTYTELKNVWNAALAHARKGFTKNVQDRIDTLDSVDGKERDDAQLIANELRQVLRQEKGQP